MWQEVRLRLFCNPAGVRHHVGELAKVTGERLSRSDATTAFVGIPTPAYHASIVAWPRIGVKRRLRAPACGYVPGGPPTCLLSLAFFVGRDFEILYRISC